MRGIGGSRRGKWASVVQTPAVKGGSVVMVTYALGALLQAGLVGRAQGTDGQRRGLGPWTWRKLCPALPGGPDLLLRLLLLLGSRERRSG